MENNNQSLEEMRIFYCLGWIEDEMYLGHDVTDTDEDDWVELYDNPTLYKKIPLVPLESWEIDKEWLTHTCNVLKEIGITHIKHSDFGMFKNWTLYTVDEFYAFMTNTQRPD